MREWWIDFQGYCKVFGDTKEQAKTNFYENIYASSLCPISDETIEIQSIEMVTPAAIQLSMFDEEYGH